MLKLERLTLAMAEHEGWLIPNEQNCPNGSIAYRNNNPGNLRKSPFSVGTIGGFALFKTEADGWAAFRWDIRQKAIGNTSTGLNGNSTLRDLIHTWAPTEDGNDPNSYLHNVMQMTGFSADMKLAEFL